MSKELYLIKTPLIEEYNEDLEKYYKIQQENWSNSEGGENDNSNDDIKAFDIKIIDDKDNLIFKETFILKTPIFSNQKHPDYYNNIKGKVEIKNRIEQLLNKYSNINYIIDGHILINDKDLLVNSYSKYIKQFKQNSDDFYGITEIRNNELIKKQKYLFNKLLGDKNFNSGDDNYQNYLIYNNKTENFINTNIDKNNLNNNNLEKIRKYFNIKNDIPILAIIFPDTYLYNIKINTDKTILTKDKYIELLTYLSIDKNIINFENYKTKIKLLLDRRKNITLEEIFNDETILLRLLNSFKENIKDYIYNDISEEFKFFTIKYYLEITVDLKMNNNYPETLKKSIVESTYKELNINKIDLQLKILNNFLSEDFYNKENVNKITKYKLWNTISWKQKLSEKFIENNFENFKDSWENLIIYQKLSMNFINKYIEDIKKHGLFVDLLKNQTLNMDFINNHIEHIQKCDQCLYNIINHQELDKTFIKNNFEKLVDINLLGLIQNQILNENMLENILTNYSNEITNMIFVSQKISKKFIEKNIDKINKLDNPKQTWNFIFTHQKILKKDINKIQIKNKNKNIINDNISK